MKLEFWQVQLHPRRTFRISRAAKREATNVILSLETDGIVGCGEASPNAFYGETADRVCEKLAAAREWLQTVRIDSIPAVAAAWEEAWQFVQPSRAAQCAIDLALWEWYARSRDCSVAELVWGEPARPVRSFATIPILEASEWPDVKPEFAGLPCIKIKSGAEPPWDIIREMGETGAIVSVDANAAWSMERLREFTIHCRGAGITFVEQPLAPSDDARMLELRKLSALPVFADESCVEERDVDRMSGRFDGFNIKLVKCGGLTPALRMLARGRVHGLQVMVGCMLETSLLVSAGSVVAQKSDYADLDGAWLLADDPFDAKQWDRGLLLPRPGAGWGIDARL